MITYTLIVVSADGGQFVRGPFDSEPKLERAIQEDWDQCEGEDLAEFIIIKTEYTTRQGVITEIERRSVS